MNRFTLLAAMFLASIGCSAQPSHEDQRTPSKDGDTADTRPHKESDGSPPEPNYSWDEQIGKRITLTGKAINSKVGAILSGDGFWIYVDLESTHWPSGFYHGGDDGEIVVVTGTVKQRGDLPVFIYDHGTPPRQGIPVPEGTNLDEASKRYLLEDVEWIRQETPTD